MSPAPHRVVGNVLDGFLNGAGQAVTSATASAKQIGKQVMSGLDEPCRELTGKNGPHRIIDAVADGTVDAVNNAIVNGGINSVRTYGEGIAKALDNPVNDIGIPPKDLGNIGPMP